MSTVRVLNLGALNTKVNPLELQEGDFIRLVNVETYPYGAKRKRPGYEAFLGTANGSSVTSLFSWRDVDNVLWLLRASGTQLYSSYQGTGAWTAMANGGIPANVHVGHAILDNKLYVGAVGGSIKYTAEGTQFFNISGVPTSGYLASKFNRIWAGKEQSLFFSAEGDGLDWVGTDSSDVTIPGPGYINGVFIANNEVVVTKTSRRIFRYNIDELYEVPTHQGPTSPFSLAEAEGGQWLYANPDGEWAFGGIKPQLLSNPIQAQYFNNAGSGVAGSTLMTAPGEVHRFQYFLTTGTVTDDVSGYTYPDNTNVYDFQTNEFFNWKLAHVPTAWHSYADKDGKQQLIFGAANGQVYKMSGTVTTDAGTPIESAMEFFIHGGAPELDKKWNELWLFFNPGCQAKIAVAVANTFRKGEKQWIELGAATEGVFQQRLPARLRGKFLFVKIYESSMTSQYDFYGCCYDGDIIAQ